MSLPVVPFLSDDALDAVSAILPADLPAAVRDAILSAVETYGDVRADEARDGI